MIKENKAINSSSQFAIRYCLSRTQTWVKWDLRKSGLGLIEH